MQALKEVKLVFGIEKTITPDSPDYSFVGLALVEVFAAQQDPRAAAILDQLYRALQTQAAKIKDDARRKAFLANIPEHREIVTLWNAQHINIRIAEE